MREHLRVVHKQDVVTANDSIKSKNPPTVKPDRWKIKLDIQSIKTRRILWPWWFAKFHKRMIRELLEYLANNDRAIALASNQMWYKGHRLTSRFFVTKDFDKEIVYVVLNPRILKYYGKVTEKSEYCMSHIGSHEIVDRYHKIIVEYFTGYGELITEVKEGSEAQIWQHEIDHLDGKQKEMKPLTEIPHNLKVSRNADCPCGSGFKYKRCCGK